MNCRQSQLDVQKLLDGVLTASERGRLDAHLAACAACRRVVDADRRLARAAGQWVRPGPPDDPGDAFTGRVLAQIAARPAPTPAPASVWLPLAASLCLVAALALLPHLPSAGLDTVGLSARLLPGWLLENFHAVPADVSGSWQALTARLPLPSWLWAALLAALAANAAFCAGARRRSLS